MIRRFISENIPFKGLIKQVLRLTGLAFQESRPTGHLLKARNVGGEIFYKRCLEELQLLERLNMKRYDISAVLDIGGNVGQNTVSSRIFFDNSVPIFTFEPSETCFVKLTAVTSEFPNTHCIKAGAGARTEELEFKISRSSETSQASTFLDFSEKYKEQYPDQAAYTATQCMVYSLDDYFKDKMDELGDNIFLHIDTEGFDLYVLQGSNNLLRHTKVIILEITYGLFQNEGSFDDIYQMLKKDFVFKGFLDPVALSPEGDSLYQDAIFVRK